MAGQLYDNKSFFPFFPFLILLKSNHHHHPSPSSSEPSDLRAPSEACSGWRETQSPDSYKGVGNILNTLLCLSGNEWTRGKKHRLAGIYIKSPPTGLYNRQNFFPISPNHCPRESGILNAAGVQSVSGSWGQFSTPDAAACDTHSALLL